MIIAICAGASPEREPPPTLGYEAYVKAAHKHMPRMRDMQAGGGVLDQHRNELAAPKACVDRLRVAHVQQCTSVPHLEALMDMCPPADA
mmetsp:Transcript_17206/g.28846  ORF Transcript_17206/g.28846 Transcript_17206/m.28846 type:complete len:89 (+) Transcript_17206:320-586(+)